MINKLKKISSSFPNDTGIYKFLSDAEILYIGKAKNLKRRINSYFSGKQTYKTQKLISYATNLEYVTTNNEVDALLLEQNLIKSEKPKFNILLRDDKSYPFIHLDESHSSKNRIKTGIKRSRWIVRPIYKCLRHENCSKPNSKGVSAKNLYR